jgi:hypothetical protein
MILGPMGGSFLPLIGGTLVDPAGSAATLKFEFRNVGGTTYPEISPLSAFGALPTGPISYMKGGLYLEDIDNAIGGPNLYFFMSASQYVYFHFDYVNNLLALNTSTNGGLDLNGNKIYFYYAGVGSSDYLGTNGGTGNLEISSAYGIDLIAPQVTATKFVTNGGASTQYVKGDGSLASDPRPLVTNNAQPRVLGSFYADSPSSGTGETTLYTFTIPANTLNADGQSIRGYYVWTPAYSGSSHNSLCQVYFAGTQMASMSPTAYNDVSGRRVDFDIIRTSSSTYRAYVVQHGTASVVTNVGNMIDATGKDFTIGQIFKVTGTTSNATYPVTARMLRVYWEPIAGG